MDSLLMPLAQLLIVSSGLAFVLGRRRFGIHLLLLGLVVAIVGPVVLDQRSAGVESSGLAVAVGSIAERASTSLTEAVVQLGVSRVWAERGVRYASYAIVLLVALNLIRRFLALFVGYSAADSAVGGVLSSLLLSVFAIVFWPFRLLRRLFVPRWD